MNEEENTRTAIILGAGASHADGAPLNLMQAYLNLGPSNNPSIEPLEQRRQRIHILVSRLFETGSCPNIEELLGVIELAIRRKVTFKGYGRGVSFVNLESNEEDLRQIREDLIMLIPEVLARKIGPGKWHGKFVRKLEEQGDLNSIVFLTTNYDILLDNALTRLLSNSSGNVTVPDYGMDCNISWVKHFERSSIPLLKLHGSLNWLFCPRCINLDVKPYQKTGYGASFQYYPCTCGQHRTPVIIPPVYLKDITNQYLIQVWNRAEKELRMVNRFVFCGYSLPPADLQFRYLLKHTQVNRDNDSSIQVYVMNAHSIDKRIKGQYERFFGASNVTYLTHKFEDFATKGLQILS